MVFFKKLHTKYLKVFFVYSLVLALFILSSFSILLIFDNKALYLNLVSLYGVIEFIIISLIFFVFSKFQWVKILLAFITILLGSTLLLNHFYIKNPFITNYQVICTSFLLIIYILIFFYSKMKKVSSLPLYQTMSFWIFAAFFLYYTGNFFFFLIIGSEQTLEIQQFLLLVYSGVTILKNILLSLSFKFFEPIENNKQSLTIPTELNLDDLSILNPNSDD